MANGPVRVVPGEGVSLYTGFGHAPFGSEHVVPLHPEIAEALVVAGAVTLHQTGPHDAAPALPMPAAQAEAAHQAD